jgi:hypothetical protein
MPYKNRDESLAYMRQWNKKWYAENKQAAYEKNLRRRKELREWIATLKGTLKCNRCPEDHPAVLDFHHSDPNEKEGTVSQAVNAMWSKKRILAEIAKCEVLCACCHRKLHWGERQ